MTETLKVGGLQPFTSVDYPGELAAVVFCQGCPWRCDYCHNRELLPASRHTDYDWLALLEWLSTRRGLLDAVVFSGGEPTLQRGLAAAMVSVRALGFKVGLHTAGCYPERLQAVLPLVDWVGLDIKALAEDYPALTGVPGSGEAAWRSARLVAAQRVPHQLRLTQDPLLISDAQIEQVRQRLACFSEVDLQIQACRPA